jgi:prepilin-type N-terminal cleavage/methylation domain-containing protein
VKESGGFSLVELLVVIAVISILASILLPTMAEIRLRTKNVLCLNNLRQMAISCTTYAINNDGWYPAMQKGGGNGSVAHGQIGMNTAGSKWWAYMWARKHDPSVFGGFYSCPKTGDKAKWKAAANGRYLSSYAASYCAGYQRFGINICVAPTNGKTHNWTCAFAMHEKIGYVPWLAVENGYPLRPGYASKRPVTNYHSINDRCPPETWLFNCPVSRVSGQYWYNLPHQSKKRAYQYVLGWKFNVAHLDTHADTHQWPVGNKIFLNYYDYYKNHDTENDRIR